MMDNLCPRRHWEDPPHLVATRYNGGSIISLIRGSMEATTVACPSTAHADRRDREIHVTSMRMSSIQSDADRIIRRTMYGKSTALNARSIHMHSLGQWRQPRSAGLCGSGSSWHACLPVRLEFCEVLTCSEGKTGGDVRPNSKSDSLSGRRRR